MNIGQTLKNLRTNKNLSKKELSEGIITPSFYSRIENGDSSITIELFLKLLAKLDVSFDEFTFIANDYQISPEERLWKNFTSAYYAEDLEKLYTEKEKLEAAYNQGHFKNRQLAVYLLTAELAICRTQNTLPEKKYTDQLFDLFFSVGTWTCSELSLFINTVHYFNLELILLLSQKLIAHAQKYGAMSEYSYLLNAALINLIGALLENNALDEAAYYITMLKNMSTSPKDLYERNMLLYLDGLRLLILGSEESGFIKVEKSIKIFAILGMTGRAERYKHEVKHLFNLDIEFAEDLNQF